MNEEQLTTTIDDFERNAIKTICETLQGYEATIHRHLADFVAALCNVEKEKMFADCNQADVSQARWLFWFAYRYMTNETYAKIGDMTSANYGKRFTKQGVAASVNKMAALIEQEPVWKKRWSIIKRIIKAQHTLIDEEAQEHPIRIVVPKNVKVELRKE